MCAYRKKLVGSKCGSLRSRVNEESLRVKSKSKEGNAGKERYISQGGRANLIQVLDPP